MKHLTQEQALKYISTQMDEEDLLEIDRHLVSCRQCVERVWALRSLRSSFDENWDSWIARPHAETQLTARAHQALQIAAKLAPSEEIRERINAWLEKTKAKGEAALGVVIDSSKHKAEIFLEGLEALCRPDPGLRFAYARAPTTKIIRTRGGARTRGAAVRTRGRIETGPPASISVSSEGPVRAEMNVDAEKKTVSIQFEGLKEPLPLLLLVPEFKEQEPIVGVLKRHNGSISTEMKDVPDGKYILLIEPIVN